MKIFLVPVDLSAATPRVCRAACDLAKLVGGRVAFLHATPPMPVMIGEYYAFDAGRLAEAMSVVGKSAARKLRSLARRFAGSCPVKTIHVTGDPTRTILAQAKAMKAAYIVIGSHGHGAMFDLIVGSTTHGVLRKARCPVLVVPVKSR